MRILKYIDTICSLAFRVASILTILLVFLTAEQVIARYVFHASSIAMQELEWYIFGACITLPIAHGFKIESHVRVDFLSRTFNDRLSKFRERAGLFLLFIALCVIFWYSVPYTYESYTYENPRANDYYTAGLLSDSTSALYAISFKLESFLRSTLLAGELSPDPGGLEARWVVKAFFPFGILLLLLQTLKLFIGTFLRENSE